MIIAAAAQVVSCPTPDPLPLYLNCRPSVCSRHMGDADGILAPASTHWVVK